VRRWHITYRLSYRDLVEMMAERGVKVAHSTILRWVTRYVPEFEKRWNRFSKVVGTSWRVDETCVSIKAKWQWISALPHIQAFGLTWRAADAITFGWPILANPDLPARLAKHAVRNTPKAKTFYTPGPAGYTNYPAFT
jgi:2,4-dienoyl-CoA reductase-like NADH-dependent reductase (Old Yellow Enzyme family)